MKLTDPEFELLRELVNNKAYEAGMIKNELKERDQRQELEGDEIVKINHAERDIDLLDSISHKLYLLRRNEIL